MDETCLLVKGVWKYLYRAVDKQGKAVDFLLTAQRDKAAARRFLDKAMQPIMFLRKSRWTRAAPTKRRLMRSMPAGKPRSWSGK